MESVGSDVWLGEMVHLNVFLVELVTKLTCNKLVTCNKSWRNWMPFQKLKMVCVKVCTGHCKIPHG